MTDPATLTRRSLVAGGVTAAGMLALGPAMWRALAATTAGPGPYGPLVQSNVPGVRVAEGFAVRQVARGGVAPTGSGYAWHTASDGAATFRTADGGWILTSNSEAAAGSGGGSSALRFAANGKIRSAYRILGATNNNCAGGPTPWGTWLSCEEREGGLVWECDPAGRLQEQARPALGANYHEAVCVDPVGQRLYLSEDRDPGGFYRFTPTTYPDLSAGLLEIAIRNAATGVVTWVQVPDPLATTTFTRDQVPGRTGFRRGEGMWFDRGKAYMATTADNRIWAYDPLTQVMDILFDGVAQPSALTNVDNVTASPFGDVYVGEDAGNLEVCVIAIDTLQVAPFLRFTGATHSGSEATGVVFDPSGRRMYVSSQRDNPGGAIYEVSGPFRLPPPIAPIPALAGRSGSGASRRSAAASAAPAAATLAAGELRPDGPLNPGGPLPPTTAVPADGNPQGLQIDAARSAARAELLATGLAVSVSLDAPATVTVVLRTAALEQRIDERGLAVAMPTDLDLVKRSLKAGTHVIDLRPRGAARATLQREAAALPAIVLVQAVRGRTVLAATRGVDIEARS